ncbi:MAG TPA: glycosyltransferase [Candidatus Saccharimonadales bacterium]|nr:glycosyltransferase [Candidatus Saccharimonadales bacterium]
MSRNVDVVAAIPNYNMADSLSVLLPQVLEQDYAAVYVMDDKSTDHSMDVLQSFAPDVTVIAGRENAGSSANRNRLIPVLGNNCIVHFLDADVRLVSDENPARLREHMQSRIGMLGGLVVDTTGQQSPWNYGPRFSLHMSVSAMLQFKLYGRHPRGLRHFMRDWPETSQIPVARNTFWVVESNMAMPSGVFKHHGFDPKLREHDIQDLAIRLQRLGHISRFVPDVAVEHTAIDVRDSNRQLAMRRAEMYIARKEGVFDWLLPDGYFRPRHHGDDETGY